MSRLDWRMPLPQHREHKSVQVCLHLHGSFVRRLLMSRAFQPCRDLNHMMDAGLPHAQHKNGLCVLPQLRAHAV